MLKKAFRKKCVTGSKGNWISVYAVSLPSVYSWSKLKEDKQHKQINKTKKQKTKKNPKKTKPKQNKNKKTKKKNKTKQKNNAEWRNDMIKDWQGTGECPEAEIQLESLWKIFLKSTNYENTKP